MAPKRSWEFQKKNTERVDDRTGPDVVDFSLEGYGSMVKREPDRGSLKITPFLRLHKQSAAAETTQGDVLCFRE